MTQLYGHQMVVRLTPSETGHRTSSTDGDNVLARHFDVVPPMRGWQVADAMRSMLADDRSETARW